MRRWEGKVTISERRRTPTLVGQEMSLEEFLALPEQKPYLELVDGRVTQQVPPQWLHGSLQPYMAGVINGYARPRKLAMAFTETREATGRDSLVPDVSVYRWARIPRTTTGRLTDGPPDPPDVAIEIVSPGQTVRGLVAKCRRYHSHGVELTLIIHPRTESVILVGRDGSVVTLRGDDLIPLGSVVPDFQLTVRELFDMLQLD